MKRRIVSVDEIKCIFYFFFFKNSNFTISPCGKKIIQENLHNEGEEKREEREEANRGVFSFSLSSLHLHFLGSYFMI